MTHLKKMMLEELQRLNYAQHPTRAYFRTVEAFARYFYCRPDRLGPRHIREYQAVLFQKRKLSRAAWLSAWPPQGSLTVRRSNGLGASPTLLIKNKDHRLPTIVSQEEVAQLIQAASSSFHRTPLMTLYARIPDSCR